MRRVAVAGAVVSLATVLVFAVAGPGGQWEGVDKTVVAKFAEEAGRPPREPYINTDRGDLLLFLFLLAGGAGGCVGGYFFRELFPPKTRDGSGRKDG